jgi:dTDP-4-amino-4,6-dideoxygalactose transaminase
VIPRKKIDVRFSDLTAGALFCLRNCDPETLEEQIDLAWPSQERVLPFLSVRSGFDATLRALNLARGSEVLVSALTIRDMEKIIQEHGLVPVPVDLDTQRLDLAFASLEAVCSEKTKAILIAHLFGSRMRMDPIIDFARSRGLLLFEDCAQAFIGTEYQGDPRSDVRMFSFGPIKTATALGGGLVFFRDPALREKADAIQHVWPRRSRHNFLKRILKYTVICSILRRPIYGVFVSVCKMLGTDHEKVIAKNVRGFAGSDFFSQIRQRPSLALLALMGRRLTRFDPVRIQERRSLAEAVMARLPDENVFGKEANDHSFWVFPIFSKNPDAMVRFLWKQGFDATRGQSSMVVIGDSKKPSEASKAYEQLLYLPIYPEVSERNIEKLLNAIQDFGMGSGDR